MKSLRATPCPGITSHSASDLLIKQIMVLSGCMLFCQVALLWQAANDTVSQQYPAVAAPGWCDAFAHGLLRLLDQWVHGILLVCCVVFEDMLCARIFVAQAAAAGVTEQRERSSDGGIFTDMDAQPLRWLGNSTSGECQAASMFCLIVPWGLASGALAIGYCSAEAGLALHPVAVLLFGSQNLTRRVWQVCNQLREDVAADGDIYIFATSANRAALPSVAPHTAALITQAYSQLLLMFLTPHRA
jgi:hypothetical protein